MKKTFLLNWLPFENVGTGAARRAIELHQRLSGQFDVTAAVTREFPANAAPLIKKKVVAEKRNLKIRLAEGSPQFWEKTGKPDVWVTDTLPVPCFKSGTKTVLTVHDLRFLVSRRYLSIQRYLLLKLRMKASLRRADAVVTVSEWITKQITEEYGIPPEKLHLIPNAAATLPASVPGREDGKEFILSVGHLEPRKDHETLIRAFALISPDWEGDLIIVGRGGLLNDLKSLARQQGVESRVRFVVGVTDAELSSFYSGCTCLVCPSVYEGFGMTILEGFTAGASVIASAIHPHREVAGDAALWFSPGSENDLAAVLAEFLRGNHRILPEKAMLRVGMYNWDDSAEKLSSLYNRI